MSDRRAFLRGSAAFPMIGGSVALIGSPTAAAVPTTTGLLQNYEAWLAWERYQLQTELWGRDAADRCTTFLAVNLPGEQWHNPWRDGEPCPRPRPAPRWCCRRWGARWITPAASTRTST